MINRQFNLKQFPCLLSGIVMIYWSWIACKNEIWFDKTKIYYQVMLLSILFLFLVFLMLILCHIISVIVTCLCLVVRTCSRPSHIANHRYPYGVWCLQSKHIKRNSMVFTMSEALLLYVSITSRSAPPLSICNILHTGS
jgi:hypothetical protein